MNSRSMAARGMPVQMRPVAMKLNASYRVAGRHFIVHPVRISYSGLMLYLSQSFAMAAASVLFILLGTGNPAAQTTQAPLLSDLDIPLMQGFQEDDGYRVVFDTPQGRIIEVRASGPHDMARVLDYYRVVLPSLSWRARAVNPENCADSGIFCMTAQRDGEILTLKIREIKGKKTKTIIYFSVNPE